MKKHVLIKSLASLLIALTFSSCDAVLDQDRIDFGNGPVLAQFEHESIVANFIKDGSVQTYEVPVQIIGGTNTPLNEAVTVTISADASSTAVAGTQYTLETTTFTIPAGQMFVNAIIKVNTAALDPFNAKTLVLKIDSSSKGVSESNTTDIVLQAVCALDMNNFVGSYTSTTAGVSKLSTVTLGSAANSLLITTGSEKILIVLNTNVTTPTITYVPEGAVFSIHATYGDVWATLIEPRLSTYNSCDFSMNLEFKRCVSIGCFAGSIVKKMVKNTN